MTKINHLHPIMTEELKNYRRCDYQVLAQQIGANVRLAISGHNGFQRIVALLDPPAEVDAYVNVGILMVMPDKKTAIRVLYTYHDLYDIQRVTFDGQNMSMEIEKELFMVDAEMLPEVLMRLAFPDS
jgi:hypothetical protein